jgi:cell division transport system ATP-binding protein
MIEFQDVAVCYAPDQRYPINALEGIELKIEDGEWVFLVGPSGAGKSTLLKLIYHGAAASAGRILVDDHDITHLKSHDIALLRRKIGVIFQDFQLLTQKTVWENIAFALQVIGAPQQQLVRDVPRALETVGLTHKAHARPHELSGGEQQRVAIARAIVNNPSILLADEPTGNLDPRTAADVALVLQRINDSGTTIVMATHDRHLVDALKKRVVRIADGHVVSDERQGIYHPEDDEPAPSTHLDVHGSPLEAILEEERAKAAAADTIANAPRNATPRSTANYGDTYSADLRDMGDAHSGGTNSGALHKGDTDRGATNTPTPRPNETHTNATYSTQAVPNQVAPSQATPSQAVSAQAPSEDYRPPSPVSGQAAIEPADGPSFAQGEDAQQEPIPDEYAQNEANRRAPRKSLMQRLMGGRPHREDTANGANGVAASETGSAPTESPTQPENEHKTAVPDAASAINVAPPAVAPGAGSTTGASAGVNPKPGGASPRQSDRPAALPVDDTAPDSVPDYIDRTLGNTAPLGSPENPIIQLDRPPSNRPYHGHD